MIKNIGRKTLKAKESREALLALLKQLGLPDKFTFAKFMDRCNEHEIRDSESSKLFEVVNDAGLFT